MSSALLQARSLVNRKRSDTEGEDNAEGDIKTVSSKRKKVKSLTNSVELEIEGVENQIRSVEVKIDDAEVKIGKAEVKIDKAEVKIDKAEVKINNVEVNINNAEAKIKSLKFKIAEIDKEITNAITKEKIHLQHAKKTLTDELEEVKDTLTFVRDDKKALMDVQKALIDDKKALIDDKKALRDKEAALIDYKKALMKEKAILLKKEEAMTTRPNQVIDLFFDASGVTENYPWKAEYPYLQLQHAQSARVSTSHKNELIYVRPQVKKLWDVLDEIIEKNNFFLVISGYPGVGKTCATWAWACWKSYKNKKEIIWIRGSSRFSMIHWHDATGSVFFRVPNFDAVISYIDSVRESDPIIIWDGLNAAALAQDYQNSMSTQSYTIVLASQGMYWREDIPGPTHFYEMESWTLDDYREACKNTTFYDGISDRLVSTAGRTTPGCTDKEDLIAERYYYAGHCARWFFSAHETLFDFYLTQSLKRVDNPGLYSTGRAAEKSQNTVHHLQAKVHGQKTIVSEYYTKVLVREMPYLELIGNFKPLFEENNPSLDGTLFEFLFLAHLKRTPEITLLDEDNKEEKWSGGGFVKIELTDMTSAPANEEWLIPKKWNRAVYDLLQLRDKSKTLRIIQVTKAKSHSYRLDVVQHVLEHLKKLQCEIEHVDFVIVYSTEKPKMKKFVSDRVRVKKLQYKDYTTKATWNADCFRYLKFSI